MTNNLKPEITVATVTGKLFNLTDIDLGQIDINDIAHGLAHQCRFNGQTYFFYSVAEHSILLHDQVSDEYKLQALLHDAAEAYLGDLIRPIKHLCPRLVELEQRLLAAIFERFEVPYPISPEVLAFDTQILVNEGSRLFTSFERWDIQGSPLMGCPIRGLPPKKAAFEFLNCFKRLRG